MIRFYYAQFLCATMLLQGFIIQGIPQEYNFTDPLLHQLDYNCVNKHARVIDAMVKRHRMMAIGINTLLVTTQLIPFVTLVNGWRTQPEIKKEALLTVADNNAVPQAYVTHFFATAKQGLYTLPTHIKNSIISGDALKGAFYAVRELGMYFAAQAIADIFLASVHHNDDLIWFVRHHAPYGQSIDLAQEYTAALMGEKILNDSQIHFYTSSLTSVCNQLIDEIEHTLGFMQHKMRRIKKSYNPQATLIIDFVFNLTQDWIKNMNDIMSAPVKDYRSIDALLKNLKSELNRECKQFVTIEKHIHIPRLLEFI